MIWKKLRRMALKGLQTKYGLTSAIALVWVTFVADIDLVHIIGTSMEVNALKREVVRVEQDAERVRTDLDDLMNNRASLERFARERYFMRRPNEDVYRLVPASE